ncbi:MAG: glycosyltransferase, partial [Anaerolineae bacterium]|nr:glycosyltransferase [Anaerolineae bacterium]
MKVVIDGVIFQLQAGRPLGISRIWLNLIPHLLRELSGHEVVLLRRSGFPIPIGTGGAREYEIPPYRLGPAKILDADDEMLTRVCADLGADVFLSTYYTRAPGVRNVLMIYDLIPEIFGFDLTQPEWLSKRRAIENADSFVTISHSTRKDLSRIYGIQPERIAVAHCGVSPEFHPVGREAVENFMERHGIRQPYFLLVGNRGSYKNSAVFFRSLSRFDGRDQVQILLVGGEPRLLPDEANCARECRITFARWLPDEELVAAYSGALALIYPSRYEGFGLPVLEAMACGCPVITSRCSSLPEVGGDAVLYVDPDSEEEMLAALRDVMNPDVRVQKAASGVERARRFTWSAMARSVVAAVVDGQRATKALGAGKTRAEGKSSVDLRRESGGGRDGEVPRYLVSAIVSVYNAERFIRGCLEDLEAQTIADRLEIVVVDTGSEQNERAIVEEFQRRYDNIVYVRTPRRESIYAAWNRGIRLAQGKYITNANADDRHRKDAFERMVEVLEARPDIALVYANVYITETENETFENHTRVGAYRWLDFDPLKLTEACFIGPQPMWRKSIHEKYGYFDESFESAGDWEFWLRIAETERFLHIDEFLGLYLRSPLGAEHRDPTLSRYEALRVRQRYQHRRARLLAGMMKSGRDGGKPPERVNGSGGSRVVAVSGDDGAMAVVDRLLAAGRAALERGDLET